jgi:hypothetical protein
MIAAFVPFAAVIGLPLGTRTVFTPGNRCIETRLFGRFAQDTFGPVLALRAIGAIRTIGAFMTGAFGPLAARAAIASTAMFAGWGFTARFAGQCFHYRSVRNH